MRVREAEALVDAALAREADAVRAGNERVGPSLRERAARVEQGAGRAAALVEEADRVAARVKALRSRTP